MKIIKGVLCALVILVLLLGVFRAPEAYQETTYYFDTVITLTVYGEGREAATEAAIARIRELDRLMNAHAEGSELAKINRAPAGTPTEVSEEVFTVISRALFFSKLTDGVFDITLKPVSDLWGIGTEHARVPAEEEIRAALLSTGWESVGLSEDDYTVTLEKEGMALDLGAIAKGYAADEAARVLKEHGIENACLDLGGNIVVMGEKPVGFWETITSGKSSRPFVVGIQKPDAPRGSIAKELTVSDCAVVSSGDYERYFEEDGVRYHHIFDAKTGMPAKSKVKSATVVAKNAMDADALSTVFFILGDEAEGKWREYYEEVLFER
ncbi:MAG: FAD:protein FMN transferase [Clostridia bacterium]|nr:FAD:protein FMN transferase [Clostridia bacterium]